MGLFDLLKRDRPIADEVFGQMKRYKEPKGDTFSSNPVFAPLGYTVDTVMTAYGEGSTADQRAFYQKLESQYTSRIVPSIVELLNSNDFVKSVKLTSANFNDIYEAAAIDLPDDGQRPAQWCITFLSKDDNDESDFTTYFSDFTPRLEE